MNYKDLYDFVKYIIDHYYEEVMSFNKTISSLISNIDTHDTKPIVPLPCEDVNEIVITRVVKGKADTALIDAHTETVLKQQLKDYLDTLPSGTVVNRSKAIDELDVKKNKRCFWKWLKDLIPGYPSLYLKY
jgi:hypothetical protein